jgi:hypothetical protein
MSIIKTVTPRSAVRKLPRNAGFDTAKLSANLEELTRDLQELQSIYNTKLYPVLTTLPMGIDDRDNIVDTPLTSTVDAFVNGLSGDQIWTDNTATGPGLVSMLFWDKLSASGHGRKLTVKESFLKVASLLADLEDRLTTLITSLATPTTYTADDQGLKLDTAINQFYLEIDPDVNPIASSQTLFKSALGLRANNATPLWNAGALFNHPIDPALSPSPGQSLQWDGVQWTHGAAGDSDWIVNGSDMYSQVSGNVGVGSHSPSNLPQDLFHIEGPGQITLRIEGDNTGDVRLRMINNSGISHYIFDDQANNNALKIESGTGADLAFKTNGSNERMRILSTGEVGIGTSMPNNTLQLVEHTPGSRCTIGMENSSTNQHEGPLINFKRDRGAPGAFVIGQDGDSMGMLQWAIYDGIDFASESARIDVQADGPIAGDDVPGRITFSTAAAGTNFSSERMRINNQGAVGIATANGNSLLNIRDYSGIDSGDLTHTGTGSPFIIVSIDAQPGAWRSATVDLILEDTTNNQLVATTIRVLYSGPNVFFTEYGRVESVPVPAAGLSVDAVWNGGSNMIDIRVDSIVSTAIEGSWFSINQAT